MAKPILEGEIPTPLPTYNFYIYGLFWQGRRIYVGATISPTQRLNGHTGWPEGTTMRILHHTGNGYEAKELEEYEIAQTPDNQGMKKSGIDISQWRIWGGNHLDMEPGNWREYCQPCKTNPMPDPMFI